MNILNKRTYFYILQLIFYTTFSHLTLADDTVGAVTGNFTVSPSGSSSYSVPIDVPPGVNNLQPELALVYNSHSGNGELGIGWGLSGKSSIDRCGTTLEQDGFIDGVDYDSNDKFCLDGQRLVLISGSSTEYRTESDSFVKVVAVGSWQSGPSYFTVYQKDGSISTYGNTGDSRFYNSTNSNIYSWSIKSASDRFNNRIEYGYTKSIGAGRPVLDTVSYGMYSIKMHWSTNRPDDMSGYVAKNTRYHVNYRLDHVSVRQGQQDVYTYNVSYKTIDRKSVIESINKCAGNICLPQTRFSFEGTNSNPNWKIASNVAGFGNIPESKDAWKFSGDFNGDGVNDIGFWYGIDGNIWIGYSKNGGFEWKAFSNARGFGDIPGSADAWKFNGDFNGDGLIDIGFWYAGDGNVWVGHSKGGNNGFDWRVYSNVKGFGNIPKSQDAWKFTGDFNGDGYNDIGFWFGGDGNVWVGYSNGSSFDWRVDTNARGFGNIPASQDAWKFDGDFNGDGLTDIGFWFGGDGNVWLGYSKGQKNGFDWQLDSGARGFGNIPRSEDAWRFTGDFNGDGLNDIGFWFGGDGNVWLGYSTGSGIQWQLDSDARGFGNIPRSADAWKFTGDFNGDGLTDLGFWFGGDGNIWIGYGEHHGVNWQLVSNAAGFGNIPRTSDAWRFYGDSTGDGLTDIGFWYAGDGNIWRLSINDPVAVLSSIKDGLGNTIDIQQESMALSGSYSKQTNSTYPVKDLQVPLYITTEVKKSNGLGGRNSTTYEYEGFKVHQQGMGGLGFKEVRATDNQTGITTHTTYSQNWEKRLTGMVEQTRLVSGQTTLTQTVNQIENRYVNNTGVFFPYVARSTIFARDLDGSFIRTTTVENILNDKGWVTDIYRCVSGKNESSHSGITPCSAFSEKQSFKHTHHEYYSEHYVNAMPGLVKTTTTTATVPHSLPFQPSTESRTIAYDYYTDSGRLKQEIVEPNTSTLRLVKDYVYNNRGQLRSTTTSGSGITPRTDTVEYDSHYRVQARLNAKQHRTSYAYEDSRFPWLVTATTDANGIAARRAYDVFGRKVIDALADGVESTTERNWCSSSPQVCESGEVFVVTKTHTNAADTHTFYDMLGREKRHVTWLYDKGVAGGNKVITRKRYNERGLLEWESEPYFSGDTQYGTTTTYDILGRPTLITGPNNNDSRYSYTAKQVEIINAKGQSNKVFQNALSQTIETQDHYGKSLHFLHDAFGNLVQTTDPAGNEVSVEYDIRGNKRRLNDPNLGEWHYWYDVLGQLYLQIDAKGQRTTMTYDVLGRSLTRTTNEGTASASTSSRYYDEGEKALGKLSRTVSGNGSWSESYSYDHLGRAKDTNTTIDGQIYTHRSRYDTLGRPSEITYPNNFTVRNVYDDATGVLTAVESDDASNRYWELGRLTARGKVNTYTMGPNIEVNKRFTENTGLPESITSSAVGSFIQNESYDWDVIGNLTEVDDRHNGVIDRFVYDQLNRIDTVTTTHTGGVDTLYTRYDDLGNITFKTGVGDYTYGGSCNGVNAGPHAVTTINAPHNTQYCYDRNGNRISGDGQNITYTAFNKPTRITHGHDRTVDIYYDANQNRYKRVDQVSGETTETIYLGNYEQVDTGSSLTHKYYLGDFALITKEQGSSHADTNFLLRNHLGSVVGVTDELGTLHENYRYDAWGKRRNPSGSVLPDFLNFVTGTTTHGFTGHEHLDPVGLIHMNGRVYDPVIGRFLSADIVVQAPEDLQSYNRYTYVRNNPLNLTDPSGYSWLSDRWHDVLDSADKLWNGIKDAATSLHQVALKWDLNYQLYKKTTNEMLRLHFRIHNKLASEIEIIGKADQYLAEHKWAQQVVTIVATYYGGPMGAAAAAAHIAYVQGGSIEDIRNVGQRAFLSSVASSYIGGYANTDSIINNAIIEGVAGGVSAEISGGSFGQGFRFGAGASILRSGIEAFTKYDAIWDTAENKHGVYKTENHHVVRVGDNHVGKATFLFPEAVWYGPAPLGQNVANPGLLAEGGLLLGWTGAYVPGFNSGALLHDVFVGTLEKAVGITNLTGFAKAGASLFTNQLTIVPVIAINYYGLGARGMAYNQESLTKQY